MKTDDGKNRQQNVKGLNNECVVLTNPRAIGELFRLKESSSKPLKRTKQVIIALKIEEKTSLPLAFPYREVNPLETRQPRMNPSIEKEDISILARLD